MSTLINDEMLARVASSKHAAIALENGAKAGYKAYIAAPGHNREYDALTHKVGFKRYCGEFGPYLEVLGLTAVEAGSIVDSTDDTIQAMIEAAVSKALSEAGFSAPAPARSSRTTKVAKAVKAKVAKAPKVKNVGRESKFSSKVVAALSIPTKKGATFTWKGKQGNTKWIVVSGSAAKGIVARKVA